MQRVHFIGIGGVGMSALARILLERGARVSGSDPAQNALTERLSADGAHIHRKQIARNLLDERPDLVVVTAAVHDDNEELSAARQAGIEVITRAALLGRLMAEHKGPRIAVAGTHGKTTTTAMIAEVLTASGLDPTALIGGEYAPIGGNVRIGRGGVFLTEACEAYDSFLTLRPDIAIITNLEADHLDHYGTAEAVAEGFGRFLDGVAVGGTVVWCADDPGARSLMRDRSEKALTYGAQSREDCSVFGSHILPTASGVGFELQARDGDGWTSHGRVNLRIPGVHNVLNALAAAAVGVACGAPMDAVCRGLEAFAGTGRRFERLAEVDGISFVDDYAHHPTEIRATLDAARAAYPDRRIVAVFQPHLYSRTRDFLPAFVDSLAAADVIFVTDIYAAREDPIPGVRVADIVRGIAAAAPKASVLYIPQVRDLAGEADRVLHAGDVVITMGAGDIRDAAVELVRLRKGRAA